jgi:hypothetical protein
VESLDSTNTVRAPSPAPHRFVVLVPGLRLVTLSNGPQFKPFMKHSIRKKQQKLVGDALDARSKVCPFQPPMVVTITRCAPGKMESDNAVDLREVRARPHRDSGSASTTSARTSSSTS